jgi:hypothetical protein
MKMEEEKKAVDTVKTAKPVDTGEDKNTGVALNNKPSFSEEQQKYIDELIGKQYAKLQSKAEQKMKELEQAEKLKSMSKIERAEAELKMAREKLAEYEREKLVSQFKVELTTKGLKPDFADFIPVQDAEKAKKAVDFLSSYKAEIESAYAEKIKDLEEKVRNLSLRGNTPLATANTLEVKRHNPTII